MTEQERLVFLKFTLRRIAVYHMSTDPKGMNSFQAVQNIAKSALRALDEDDEAIAQSLSHPR